MASNYHHLEKKLILLKFLPVIYIFSVLCLIQFISLVFFYLAINDGAFWQKQMMDKSRYIFSQKSSIVYV